MPGITSANAANAILKLIAARALDVLEPVMVMGSLVNRDFDAQLAGGGDTVNVPIPGVMVSNNISENGQVQTQNPSLGNAVVTLNQHEEASFALPDVLKVLAVPGLLDLYMKPAVVAVATAMEQSLLGLYANLTSNTAVGTGAAGLGSESVIDSAEKALFKAYVPENSPRYLVVGADAYSDLRQIPRFTEAKTIGTGDAIQTGFVGNLKNFRVFRSQLVPKVSTTTYNMAFASDAFALVTRQLPQPLPGTGAIAEYTNKNGYGLRIIMSYQANTLQQQFTVDALFGVAILRNVFGLQVLS